MRLLTILLFFMVTVKTYGHKKCCDGESTLKKTSDSSYICEKDSDKRLQIFTLETDYLKQSASDDSCLDINDMIVEYKIRNHTIVEEVPWEVNFFPKCCPLNFYYDSTTHSCVWKENIDHGFIKQKFIKVGLPQCRVIVDYKLKSGMSDYHRIEVATLHVGDSTTFPEGKYCMDRDEDGFLIARGCHEDLKICDKMKCIHKCCPDGQSFVNGSKCKNTYKYGLNLTFTDAIRNPSDPFAVVHGFSCKIYILRQERTQHYLDENGIFWAFYNKTFSYKPFKVDEKSYCIEHAYKNTQTKKMNDFEFFMCFADNSIKGKFLWARWAKIVSSVFIFMTIVVYLLLPEMMNLFGKILLSYCASTLASFIILIYSQFVNDTSDILCVRISFSALYPSLSSFTWLNVMCFDIWWTFGTPKSLLTAIQRKNELRRFLFYSLYGWGAPAIITLLTYLAYVSVHTPQVIKPYIGSYKCYWESRPGNYAMFLYYVTPLIIMEMTNIFLFIKTITYCLKVKGEINRMNDNRISAKERKKSFNSDKEQLVLILKLSVIMGISFVFEVVSTFVDFEKYTVTAYIEIVWDTFNCMQGVFIFFIFICKVKVFKLFKTKLRGVKVRKISLSSLTVATSHVSTPLTSSGLKLRNV